MTRKEFVKTAEDCGYTDEEIQDLLSMHDELELPYDQIPLVMHNVD